MSLIAGEGVGKNFGAGYIFEDLSFALEPDDRVGLVGPNGQGKTTLLKIIAGMEEATKGAFQGKTSAEAYFVKCDKETTPQNDINLGIVNIVVGFAPLKPAEFVIIKLQQMAGQIQA